LFGGRERPQVELAPSAFGQSEDVTGQVSDHLRLGDRRWDVAAIDGDGLFDPADVGIESVAASSANWRGFVCGYAVVDDRFVLEDLWLSGLSTLHGQQVTMLPQLLGVVPEPADDWGGDLRLRGVNLSVTFSGRLLVGNGFLDELYEHMGFHPAWKFEEVRELHVEQGRVTADVDRSQRLAEVREQIMAGERGQPRPQGPRGQMDWIEQSFSLDWRRSLPDE
jgi:hypothetical protein